MFVKVVVWLIIGCFIGFGWVLVIFLFVWGDKVIVIVCKFYDFDYIRDNKDVLLIQLDVCEFEYVLCQKIE